ncbi:hypothetical protein [Spiroplasma tabanidicola]|uniref:Uncharacterized protein n=1 Tax=Spiroplasma tabanidicola TaxID=324079 RepID=A0A6I6CIF2_9MOLU|nr:hypothetical protein [Spiroplasma tabanidicola]QGS51843.1 hypothetical protein STABA_v1c04800 [Spiroplasma tabanidicola]
MNEIKIENPTSEGKESKKFLTLLKVNCFIISLIGLGLFIFAIIYGRVLIGNYKREENVLDPQWYYYVIFFFGVYYFASQISLAIGIEKILKRINYSLYQRKVFILCNLLVMVLTVLTSSTLYLFLKYNKALEKEGYDDKEQFDYYVNTKINPRFNMKILVTTTFGITIFFSLFVGFLIYAYLKNIDFISWNFTTVIIGSYSFMIVFGSSTICARFLCDTNAFLNSDNKIDTKWFVISSIPIIGPITLLIYYSKKKIVNKRDKVI